MHYDFIDVSHFKFLQPEGSGTAESYWLEDTTGVRYLWKHEFSEDYLFNEVISFNIAQQIGLQSAECCLAAYNGVTGVLSKDVDYYGCKMRNLIEIYPNFRFIQGNLYSINSFSELIHPSMKTAIKISYKKLIDLLLFDYLIENVDRHFGNIGIDSSTGDIAPFYDNAASLSLNNVPKFSLIYDEGAGIEVPHAQIPDHLANSLGEIFLTYGSIFYKACTSLDIFEILMPFDKVMGRMKHGDYMDILPEMLDSRIKKLKKTLMSMV